MFSTDIPTWEKGVLYAEGQNLARLLMETPANHLTPTIFANTIEEKVAPHAERLIVKKRFVFYSSLRPPSCTFYIQFPSCAKQSG